ncbi:hypothetical protein QVD99_007517 [Batrachochytrium dendrobatidis]|nr:hypothetical protein QVD99_007517 [Batrachochytrium dendrobatidis]
MDQPLVNKKHLLKPRPAALIHKDSRPVAFLSVENSPQDPESSTDKSTEPADELESDILEDDSIALGETTGLPDLSIEDVAKLRTESLERLKSTWEIICSKYGRSFEGESDEIDLTTGRIVIDRGFLKRSHSKAIGHSIPSTLLARDMKLAIDSLENENTHDGLGPHVATEDPHLDPLTSHPIPTTSFGAGMASAITNITKSSTSSLPTESQADMIISELLYDDDAFDRILLPRSEIYRSMTTLNLPFEDLDSSDEDGLLDMSDYTSETSGTYTIDLTDDINNNSIDPLVLQDSQLSPFNQAGNASLPRTDRIISAFDQNLSHSSSPLSRSIYMDNHYDLDPLTTPTKMIRRLSPIRQEYWSMDTQAMAQRKNPRYSHRMRSYHSPTRRSHAVLPRNPSLGRRDWPNQHIEDASQHQWIDLKNAFEYLSDFDSHQFEEHVPIHQQLPGHVSHSRQHTEPRSRHYTSRLERVDHCWDTMSQHDVYQSELDTQVQFETPRQSRMQHNIQFDHYVENEWE